MKKLFSGSGVLRNSLFQARDVSLNFFLCVDFDIIFWLANRKLSHFCMLTTVSTHRRVKW